ncbi:CHAT domain-containing protein [Kitasatospora sp. NPDC059327]|uniref:CHAT domain-containing protein n=1 Tax=Kitasatospora sp. NPDC059327 TaxID=3346803 RepID=UPI00367A58E8
MPRDLLVEIQQNPSADYTVLPRTPGPDDPPGARTPAPLDLVVALRRHRDNVLHISAYRPGRPSPRTREHQAYLTITVAELLRMAARLRGIWRERLVGHCELDDDGMPVDYPFADAVDVSHLAPAAERQMAELAEEGRYLFEKMLKGADPNLVAFRAFLSGALGEQGLRVRFDSELHLPWPMLAVDTGSGEPWTDFLGHRHQIEQTGAAYPAVQAPYPPRERPVTSLNTDDTLELVGRAPEVRKLLEDRSQLTVRTESTGLLEALSCAVLDEDLMYFWCHGQFIENDSPHAQLAVRLSDDRPIDADLVRRHRERHRDLPDATFNPFVLLNACHTGQAAAAELEHLGQALVELGADGVLGPQIEIPQVFASEYALAFLDLYLTGESTAGEITWELVRRFTRDYRNPLALTYSLHCGIDSILELSS